MDLDSRKLHILKSIIRTYLETGEPVGSRTISKESGLNVSSATIRNEMADLEEMGLIEQPHTSAGRIPTDKGYRLYVDTMMEDRQRENLDFRDLINQRMDQIENVLQRMARVLAANTNYTTMITGPSMHDTALKLIQLSYLDSRHLICVIVLEGNVMENRVIEVESNLSNEEILRLNVLLNSALQGKTLDDINLSMIQSLKEQAGDFSGVIGQVLEATAEMITSGKQKKPDVYTSGATNIFKYPELNVGSTASEILSTFEDKNQLLDILDTKNTDPQNPNIRVYIGNETSVSAMADCSVVTANYELGKGIRGSIGIIGPKRMDYEHVVGTLKTLMEQLDNIYNNQ